jgi:glutathione synthase/RimK-type ligase-like ATP-grasp enzyme
MWAGQNLWVLKPNDFNRGRGVHIFNKLEDAKRLINEYTNPLDDTTTVQSELFVIQKYIEKPMLI